MGEIFHKLKNPIFYIDNQSYSNDVWNIWRLKFQTAHPAILGGGGQNN